MLEKAGSYVAEQTDGKVEAAVFEKIAWLVIESVGMRQDDGGRSPRRSSLLSSVQGVLQGTSGPSSASSHAALLVNVVKSTVGPRLHDYLKARGSHFIQEQARNTKTNAQAEVKVRPSSAGGGAAADDGGGAGGAGGAGGGSKAGSDGDSIGPALGMRAMPGPVITLPLPFSSMLPTLFF